MQHTMFIGQCHDVDFNDPHFPRYALCRKRPVSALLLIELEGDLATEWSVARTQFITKCSYFLLQQPIKFVRSSTHLIDTEILNHMSKRTFSDRNILSLLQSVWPIHQVLSQILQSLSEKTFVSCCSKIFLWARWHSCCPINNFKTMKAHCTHYYY